MIERNRNQWLSVASFLALQNLRIVLQARRAEGAPLAGEASAQRAAINFGYNAPPLPPVPDGNHGDNFSGREA